MKLIAPHSRFAVLLTLAACVSVRSGWAGDWPMWRHDAQRSAATDEILADELHLQWIRELPPLKPTWPDQAKLTSDAVYEPIALDGMLFVASSRNDSLTAYDISTGEQQWRFFADGPIRFAPVAGGGNVYLASDDGHLYCIAAKTGKLVRKFRGGPTDRTVLGNGRLISTWPARGAPVLLDGSVYFAAGIWPFMGIFLHALDAETFEVQWTNDSTGSLYIKQPHNSDAFAGLAPQGYLAATGDKLLVPNGRAVPACLDRRTGKLLYFHHAQHSRSGGYRVAAAGKIFFCESQAYDLETGLGVMRLASDRPPVLTSARLFAGGASLTAFEVEPSTKQVLDRKGRVQTELLLQPAWEFKDGIAGMDLHLRAGPRLYGADRSRVCAIRIPEEGEKPKVEWNAAVDGRVATMLAADGRLIVVTHEGRILCFGPQQTTPPTFAAEPHDHATVDADRAASAIVAALLDRTGARDGFCAVIGLDDGATLRELVRQSNLHVVAFDADAAKVDAVRRELDAAGLYGDRVAVQAVDPAKVSLPPYFASLIVALDSDRTQIANDSALIARLFAALRPYGGAACFSAEPDDLETVVAAQRLANVGLTVGDGFTVLKRIGSLPGSAEWTHQYADAANSVVSNDRLVKLPLGLLWFGGPSNEKILPRHGHGPSPQVAGGRLFIEGPDILRATDVYTGRLLWERELPGVGKYYNTTSHFPGAGEIGSNYVSLSDRVYVLYGSDILELDAATGDVTRRLQHSAAGLAPVWGFIAAEGDLLIAAAEPVTVGGPADSAKPSDKTPDFAPLIKPNETWDFLAGADPEGDWTELDYSANDWKQGRAGFGFGDSDDRTELPDMPGRYTRVYLRKEFDGSLVAQADELALMVNYDDGFIAYLNGTEVVRAGVGKGSGPTAEDIPSHEASKHELFPIRDFQQLRQPGKNVIAIEGHNRTLKSSDFSLDPYVVVNRGGAAGNTDSPNGSKPSATPKESPASPLTTHQTPLTKPKPSATAERSPTPNGEDIGSALTPARYSSASRRLVVFQRHSGEVLWSRDAEFSFRHNCLVAAAGRIYCIDGVSPAQMAVLKRRGLDQSGTARLLALDAQTGEELWSTSEDVFGTFLNYSAEYDVLLQAGSASRDRAKDEVGQGMIAYRGRDGRVLWSDRAVSYHGPCLLWRDKIITNGSDGFQLELLTGRRTAWSFTRNYGCNTVLGSQNLLTFRSAAAGFCDLARNGGTGNLGGFRSSCTSNLIAADGVLSAPDYTRTCTCGYQNQTSLALIHTPEAELWTFNASKLRGDVKRIGINLGAPGDRVSDDGTLWFEYPVVGGPSPTIGLTVQPKSPDWFCHHASRFEATDAGGSNWVAASGGKGIEAVTVDLASLAITDTAVSVRLHFAEPDDVQAGERVFSVALQGRILLNALDVVREAGGPRRAVVKDFRVTCPNHKLKVELTPLPGSAAPLLCGIEIIAE